MRSLKPQRGTPPSWLHWAARHFDRLAGHGNAVPWVKRWSFGLGPKKLQIAEIRQGEKPSRFFGQGRMDTPLLRQVTIMQDAAENDLVINI